MPRLASLLACVSLGLALFAAAARAENWERFRGPNGEGIANNQNIPILFDLKTDLRWKVKIPGDSNGSPIVWGDRIFLMTAPLDGSERSLLCLDAKTGAEMWKRSIKGTNVKFRKDSSHASATPTTDGEAVYVPFWNGKNILMTAYNFKGDKLWERDLGEFVSQHGAGMSPILYKNLLIFSVDKDAFRDAIKKVGPVQNPSTVYALDKKTGKTVWETPREADRACYTMPFLIERKGVGPEVVVTSMTAITGYDPLTGKANWYYTWTWANGPLRAINQTVHADGVLMACTGDGSGERLMVAVALKGQGKDIHPEKVWSNSKKFPYVTGMLTRGANVYFVNDLGMAGCFDVKSGKQLWFERVPDAKFYASPVLIDGRIYACSEQGDIHVIAAEPSYQYLAKNSLGERMRASPAVANGRMYVRGQHHLYCIGNK